MSDHREEIETILVVEDNIDLQLILQTELEEDYKVLLASNGTDGLKLAMIDVPDLIITDIMMPVMSGLELCKELKSNEITNHIPVIMLTALGKEYEQIEGLEVGANDYISKPFSVPILKMRVHNLLISMRNYRIRILLEFNEKGGIEAVPFEDPFMKRILAKVRDHMSNSEFGVEQLAEDMHMSERTLQRKLKAMIDKTPQDAIRSIRLNKARNLLENDSLTVSEVAFKVGFQEPTNFSRSFKKQFGFSPSYYRNDQEAE